MSHFSKIKTSIRKLDTLQKTLTDLGLTWRLTNINMQDNSNYKHNADILLDEGNKSQYGFIWNGNEYELLADLQFWDNHISVEGFLDKITQRYAYNSIIAESQSQGFDNIKETFLVDGSIKIELQRWSD
uniref:Uncharacterized protein ycf35 n=1 Tax=Ahnfeltia plicata TaxID=28023 RepID=A0A1C9CB61_9FLOR|nr:hypothetical protein Ahnf_131 [Ahnfeltia plicata]AOM65616.1 hypothetical protein Ahnf_131 [Ahnfeltia plicata]UAT97235.1 hypothetical protein Ahn.pli.UK.pt_065 [Ahnfeltia plicata]UAT97440.1 hypothetical protein Ahn.pli.Chile.pt_065 [Ahnfeltia plicata]